MSIRTGRRHQRPIHDPDTGAPRHGARYRKAIWRAPSNERIRSAGGPHTVERILDEVCTHLGSDGLRVVVGFGQAGQLKIAARNLRQGEQTARSIPASRKRQEDGSHLGQGVAQPAHEATSVGPAVEDSAAAIVSAKPPTARPRNLALVDTRTSTRDTSRNF